MRRAFIFLMGYCLAAPAAQAQQGVVVAAWVQYAPGTSSAATAGVWGDAPTSLANTVLIRAVVTDANACPVAQLDHGLPLPLARRFIGRQAPSGFVRAGAAAAFPDGTPMATADWGECEAVVPPGHHAASLAGVELKLPAANPTRILVMGDTGCRLYASVDGPAPDCHSPASFALSYLSQVEAGFKPDVILHVGDWTHREPPCPAGTLCGARQADFADPAGDTFDAWNADVFTPARPLLGVAPWIMLRGNDESCGRGARGWFALLDPFPYRADYASCARTRNYPPPLPTGAGYTADFQPTYVVPLHGVNFIIHDSSFARDGDADLDLAENYDIDLTAMLSALRVAAPGAADIFVTHKPTFDRSRREPVSSCDAGHNGAGNESNNDVTAIFGGNLTMQAVVGGTTGRMGTAFSDGVPPDIALFLSGHMHQFRYLNIGTGDGVNEQYAPQMIVGTGGSLASADCSTMPDGASAGIFANDAFGFAVLDLVTDAGGAPTGFTAQIYKVSAARAGMCSVRFSPRLVNCHL